MSQKEQRYVVSQYSGTIGGPMTRAVAELPKQAYDGGKVLEKEGAKQVQIFDSVTGKVYDLASFAKEHRLK